MGYDGLGAIGTPKIHKHIGWMPWQQMTLMPRLPEGCKLGACMIVSRATVAPEAISKIQYDITCISLKPRRRQGLWKNLLSEGVLQHFKDSMNVSGFQPQEIECSVCRVYSSGLGWTPGTSPKPSASFE